MGIRGLTTLLQKRGVFPPLPPENNNSNLKESKYYQTISPESTLSIDGPGLAFYIYERAYKEYYHSFLQHSKKREADVITTINHLLPAMLPLHYIHFYTTKMMTAVLNSHSVNVMIYWDGPNKRMKSYTQKSRNSKRDSQKKNLERFIKHGILPKSFKTHTTKKVPPSADIFLDEFPMPILVLSQVRYTLEYMELFFSSKETTILQNVFCDEEADREVALSSALDVSNKTYAVGSDSDYCIYGFLPATTTTTTTSACVLYAPLHYLQWEDNADSSSLGGIVVTRRDVTYALNLDSESMLLEASILMGNDYTSEYILSQHKNSCNFFKEFSNGSSSSGGEKLTYEDILLTLSHTDDDDEGGSTYQITSKKKEFQYAIEFTRALYGFGDITSYPLDRDDKEKEDLNDVTSDGNDDDIFSFTPSPKSWNKIRYLVEEMVEDDTSWDTFKLQILAPFHDKEQRDTNVLLGYLSMVLKVMQRHQLKYQEQENEKPPIYYLPSEFQWKYQQISQHLQKSISIAMKERSKHGVISSHLPLSPFVIFHPVVFHRTILALISRNNGVATTTSSVPSSSRKENSNAQPQPPQLDEDATSKNDENHIENTSPSSMKILPIDEHKDTILKSVKENRVTIIQGETGCGKSSRVPIMLLETPPPDPSIKEIRMYICQPRRIAAKSLFERIKTTHAEHKHLFGLRMGHGIKEETKSTRIWFATTGYLVRLLANKPEYFDKCSHLVIDEVHERSVETDVLCLLARRLLQRNKHIRLILMSATVAADMYRDYFEVTEPPLFVGVRCFPVQEYYLEDIVKLLQLSPREETKINEIANKITNSRCKMVPNSNDRVSIHDLAVQLAAVVSTTGSAVLIFVPGMADIINIMELFDNVVCHGKSFKCIPIHSDVPFEDQMSAFDDVEEGKVKIIIATNAAESSVTLPDVDHVICLGLCKQISYNPQSHRQILDSTWISKASATQRAGRTGRVRKGNVYRLYPRVTFEEHMAPFEEGEILRTPLDSVILNLRTITDNESITELLLDCLEPPSLDNVERSLGSLYECNFISEPSDDFAITSLGSFVVALGVDLALGSFIGYGIRMGVGPEAIDVAAALSSPKSPWLIPNGLLQEPDTYNDIVSKTYVSKGHFDANLYSEPLAISNLLWDFDRLGQNSGKMHAFCRKYAVHYPRLKFIQSTRNSLRLRVSNALGIDSDRLVLEKPPRTTCRKKITILRAIHVWLFHDCIIKLDTSEKHIKTSGDDPSFKIELKGDLIEEKHLSQVLNPSRHEFCLNTDCNAVFHASYQLEEIDFSPFVIEDDEFERRLLSLAVENGISCVLLMESDTFNLYINPEFLTEIMNQVGDTFCLEAIFVCNKNAESNHRGWKERDCGAWSCMIVDDVAEDCDNLMMKYSYSGGSKTNRRKAFTKFRKLLQKNFTSSALCFNLKRSYELDKSGNVTMFTYRSIYTPTDTIMADLLGTTPCKVKFTGQTEHNRSQSITFKGDEVQPSTDCLLENNNAPEAARIIIAAASGYNRSRKAVLHFRESSKNKAAHIDESDMFLETFPQVTKTSARWNHAGSGGYIFLDGTNFPASICPMEQMEILACCGNTLELNGGGYRVESLTLLPPGTSFAGLAMKCIGIDAGFGAIMPEFRNRLELVELFRERLMDPTGDHLEYCSELSNIFAEIFALFINDENSGYKTDDSCGTDNEEKKTYSEEVNEEDTNSYVSYIAGKIGAEYMPSSFLALASNEDGGDSSVKGKMESKMEEKGS